MQDTEDQLRHEICRIGLSLYERSYVHATAGNISVRLPDQQGYLITPTDACLGALNPETLSKIDLNGEQLSGDRASKTIQLHRAIYEANPEAHCVIHTHSTHLVGVSLSGVWSKDDIVPPITPYYVMKVGHVPLIPYAIPGSAEVVKAVIERLKISQETQMTLRAVMLERLGPVVWHASLKEASATLEELEETAKLWLMTKANALSDEQVQALCRQFNVTW
jgi:ribulose-5-phosphate 4-epimerase/fuculose-1-phosphate aldolase